MPTYLSPGVYVEEVPAGSRPIEGVGTSVAAFVGLAAKGPINEPTLVSNWTQFTETFGDFVENSYLAHAVYGWFLNGGGNCFVVRIAPDSGNGTPAARRSSAPKQAAIGGYTVDVDREGRDRDQGHQAQRRAGRRRRARRTTSSSWSSSSTARPRRPTTTSPPRPGTTTSRPRSTPPRS